MLCRGSSLLVIVGDVYVLSQNSYWRNVINYCSENYLGEELSKEYIEKRKQKDDLPEETTQNSSNFTQPKSYKLLVENLNNSGSNHNNTSSVSPNSSSSGILGVNLHPHIFSPNNNILRDTSSSSSSSSLFNNNSSNPSLSLSVNSGTRSLSPPPPSSGGLRNSNDNTSGLNTSNPKLDLSLSLPTMTLSNPLSNPKLSEPPSKKIDSPIYNNSSFGSSLYTPPFFSHGISRNNMFNPSNSSGGSTSTNPSSSQNFLSIPSNSSLIDYDLVYSFQKFPLIFYHRNFGCPPISVSQEVSRFLEIKISSFMSNSTVSVDKQNNSISVQLSLKPNTNNTQIVVGSLGKSELSKVVITPEITVFDLKLVEIYKSENFVLIQIPYFQKISI